MKDSKKNTEFSNQILEAYKYAKKNNIYVGGKSPKELYEKLRFATRNKEFKDGRIVKKQELPRQQERSAIDRLQTAMNNLRDRK